MHHGNGIQKRSFLYVGDFCRAVGQVANKGKLFEAYNIGTNFEYKNKDVVKLISKINNKDFIKNTIYIKDRPFNDYRYSLNCNKIRKLDWKPLFKIEDKIKEINNWYKINLKRFKKRY